MSYLKLFSTQLSDSSSSFSVRTLLIRERVNSRKRCKIGTKIYIYTTNH